MVTETRHTNGIRPVTTERPRTHGDVDWSLLSAQGKVLFYTALCPVCSVQEIATSLGLTERAVWGIIRDLRRNDMLHLRRDNRRHRYSVNLDAPLLHPTIQGLTLRPVLGQIAENALREPNSECVRIRSRQESRGLQPPPLLHPRLQAREQQAVRQQTDDENHQHDRDDEAVVVLAAADVQ